MIHTAPQTHDLNIANWIASTKTRGAKTESLNVRLWLLADIQAVSDLRPLYPRKQTSRAGESYFCKPICKRTPHYRLIHTTILQYGEIQKLNYIRRLHTKRDVPTRPPPHSKTVVPLRVPWVRIPPPPPNTKGASERAPLVIGDGGSVDGAKVRNRRRASAGDERAQRGQSHPLRQPVVSQRPVLMGVPGRVCISRGYRALSD